MSQTSYATIAYDADGNRVHNARHTRRREAEQAYRREARYWVPRGGWVCATLTTQWMGATHTVVLVPPPDTPETPAQAMTRAGVEPML